MKRLVITLLFTEAPDTVYELEIFKLPNYYMHLRHGPLVWEYLSPISANTMFRSLVLQGSVGLLWDVSGPVKKIVDSEFVGVETKFRIL